MSDRLTNQKGRAIFSFLGGQKDRSFLESEKNQKYLQWLRNRGTTSNEVFSNQRINGHKILERRDFISSIFQIFTPVGYPAVVSTDDDKITGSSLDIPIWDLALEELDVVTYPTIPDFNSLFELPELGFSYNPQDPSISSNINSPTSNKSEPSKLEDYYDEVCYPANPHLSNGYESLYNEKEEDLLIPVDKLPDILPFIPPQISTYNPTSSPSVGIEVKQSSTSGLRLFERRADGGQYFYTARVTSVKANKAVLNLKSTYKEINGKPPDRVKVYYQGTKTGDGLAWADHVPENKAFQYEQVYSVPPPDDNGDRLIPLESPFPQAGGIVHWINYAVTGNAWKRAWYSCELVGFCYLYRK